jgi:uncharacterized protein
MKAHILAASLFIAVTSCASTGDNAPTQVSPAADSPSVSSPSVAVGAMPSKEDDIRKMLHLTGAGKIGEQIMDQMFDTLRQSMRQVPQHVWDEIINEFKVEFAADKLIEMNVPIYARHFSQDEIRELIAFYESPIGRKLASVTPLLAKESFEVGVAHGQRVMSNVLERLQSRGYKPPVAY